MRACEAGRERGEREQCQRGREVPQPPGTAADQVRHERRAGEDGGLLPAPALEQDVAGDGQRDGQQREQHQRPGEAHRRPPRRRRWFASGRSQSPSVETTTCADAERGQLASDLGALGGRGGGEALAQPGAGRVDAQLASGLGIDEPELAHVRQRLLARIADLDREHVVAAGELEQRRPPVARAAEVGDDGDERALACEPGDEVERAAERGRAAALEDGLAPEREQQPEHACPPLPRRDRLRVAVAERDEAEPVAAAAREVAERERHAFGDVGLPALRGAERHRRRDVERQPRHEHALGEVDTHVRLARSGGHVPLDPAHVVPGDVRPHLCELAAGAEDRGAMVAGEQPFDPPPDRQVERAEQGLGQRAGPRTVRRALLRCRLGSDRQAALSRLPSSISGAATFASTASRITSASTCSASAW